MTVNVAVVCGGGFQGQGIVEAVHAIEGGRAVVFDATYDAPAQVVADAYVIAPELADEERFVGTLNDLTRDECIDLVIPATQRELALLARHAKRIGAPVAVCPPGLLDTLLDKRALFSALASAAIPVQPLRTIVAAAGAKLFGRPRHGWGGHDSQILEPGHAASPAEWSALEESHAWVDWLDRFIEYSVDFAIDFDGIASPLTVRRRLRTSGGFAVASESDDAPAVMDAALRLCRWLVGEGGRGLFNVQVIMPRDGTVLVSDVNPRHGTSSGHALAEGNNLVAHMLGLGEALPRHAVRSFRVLSQRSLPRLDDRGIQGVVLDLDHTLIDQKAWMFERMVAALGQLAAHRTLDRDPALRVAWEALEEGAYEHLVDRVACAIAGADCRDDLLEAYRASIPARARVYPDVPDALRNLRRAGVTLALLTDNPPASQRSKLAAAPGLAGLFDAVVFSREHGDEKPASTAFAAAAHALGLAPARLLMVGDHPSRDAVGSIDHGFAACCLVQRPGTRFAVHERMFRSVAPQAWSRTWIAPDLRGLHLALGALQPRTG